MRTPEEIKARIAEVASSDFLGFQREVLITALPFEIASEFLKEGTTAEEWAAQSEETAEKQAAESARYLEFAIGKATDHRGISAGRSVEKLEAHAWVAGRDDVLRAMEVAGYQNYGAPKLKAFALAMRLEWPSIKANLEINRMAEGLSCRPGCDEGCDS